MLSIIKIKVTIAFQTFMNIKKKLMHLKSSKCSKWMMNYLLCMHHKTLDTPITFTVKPKLFGQVKIPNNLQGMLSKYIKIKTLKNIYVQKLNTL